MSYAIVMPQLGLTMTEGAVSEWLKKPGDAVQKNEAVFIVSTDKVDMEVESVVEGTMGEILVQPGETVPVGTTLAYVQGEEGESSIDAKPASVGETPDPESRRNGTGAQQQLKAQGRTTSHEIHGRPKASPRAKRLAEKLGVDLGQLAGTGGSGQIVEEDVRGAASTESYATQSKTQWRQWMAERLTRSIQSIPAFSVSAEANAEKLLALRLQLQQLATASEVKVTVTDLLLAIFASVLKATPDLCAVWENGAPRARNSVDIGLAVASEFGSVAPVIKDVASLDLLQLLAIRHHLVERGREGKLSLTETEGGIATLNNLGMYRIDRCQSVITPGQSSVLTMGSIRIRPWVEAALVVKPTVILNLTVDHRVADGDAAATFLNKLIELIENPARLNLRTGLTSQAVASGRTNV